MAFKLRSSVTLLSTIVTVVRTVALIVLGKVIAVFLGPAGHALFGNIQNIMGLAQSVGARSMQNGVVRYSAESQSTPHIRMGFLVSAGGVLIWTVAILILREEVSNLVGLPLMLWHIVGMALSAFMVSLLVVFISRLQGSEQYKHWAQASLVIVVVQVVLLAGAVVLWGTSVLFLAYLIIPIVQVVLLLPLIIKEFTTADFIGALDRKALKDMSSYLVMGFVSAGIMPIVMLFIRWRLTHSHSLDVAGLWQGLWGLSDKGVAMITAIFVTAYLPRLVKAESLQARGALMRQTLLRAGAVIILGTVTAWYFRNPLVNLLLSESFLPITDVMGLQFIGDLFRIFGWVVGMGLVAQGRTKLFIAFEVGFMLLFMTVSHFMIASLGMQGVVIAYLIESLTYFAAVVLVYRKELLSW